MDDFFKCGDQRTWKKRALKAKLIKRALQSQETRLYFGNDLSQSVTEEDHDITSWLSTASHGGQRVATQEAVQRSEANDPETKT